MQKRKDAFLNKKSKLTSFTLKGLSTLGFTKEEIQKMIDDNFIVLQPREICVDCFRSWEIDAEECQYCGCEDSYTDNFNYTYSV